MHSLPLPLLSRVFLGVGSHSLGVNCETCLYILQAFLRPKKAPTNTAPGRFLRSDGRFLRSIWALSQVYGRFLRSDGRFLRSDGRFLRSEGRVGQGMVGVDGVWWWGSMKMLGFTSIPLIAVSRALDTVSRALVTVSTPLVTVLRYLVTVCS